MNSLNYFPQLYNPFMIPERIEHESPETAIARQIPRPLLISLDKESKRKRYNEALAIGAEVVKTYLSKSSQENINNLGEINIQPKISENIFGKNKGMRISFKRRK